MKVEFENSQKLNGSEIKELDLVDLDKLKGRDIIELETAFRQLYKGYVPVPAIDMRFQALVAARAAKINPKDLEELDADAFMQVCATVRDFLVK